MSWGPRVVCSKDQLAKIRFVAPLRGSDDFAYFQSILPVRPRRFFQGLTQSGPSVFVGAGVEECQHLGFRRHSGLVANALRKQHESTNRVRPMVVGVRRGLPT